MLYLLISCIKGFVGEDVVVTNNCIVGSLVSLRQEEVLPANHVFYSDKGMRRPCGEITVCVSESFLRCFILLCFVVGPSVFAN